MNLNARKIIYTYASLIRRRLSCVVRSENRFSRCFVSSRVWTNIRFEFVFGHGHQLLAHKSPNIVKLFVYFSRCTRSISSQNGMECEHFRSVAKAKKKEKIVPALWRCVTKNGGRPNQLRRLNGNNERHGIIVKWRNHFILWNMKCYEIRQNLASSLTRWSSCKRCCRMPPASIGFHLPKALNAL